MNVQRVQRLLQILQMLQAGDGQNPDGLARLTGVSRRTAFRDIESLKKVGIPVEFDRETDRYRVAGDYFLPPTNFTAEEALAIIGLSTQVGGDESLPFFEPARKAALKLQASLPAEVRNQLRELSLSVDIRPRQINPLDGQQDIYQQLVRAQADRKQVWMAYNSLTEWDRIETTLSPYQVFFSNRSWYVVGRSKLHKEVRTFNLGRIAELRFESATYKVPQGWSLEKHLGNAWRMMPEAGPDTKVHLRFGAMVAKNVAEVRWHKTQQVIWREDRSIDFHVTVSGIEEISWWILQYGDQVEVLKPAKLRHKIAQRVQNMAAIYGGGQ